MSSNPSWWIFFGCSELLFGPLNWIFDSQPIANLIQLQCFLRWASILDDCSNPCSPIHAEKKLPSDKSERNVSRRRPSLYSVLIRQKSQRWIYFFLSRGTGGMSLYMYFRFENTHSDNQVSLFCYYHLLRPNDWECFPCFVFEYN